MTQQSLFDLGSPVKFDGATYDDKRDKKRLQAQFHRVFDLMKDGRWRTLKEISATTGHAEASISARLRDLRKVRFGSWDVQRRHVMHGLFEYRVMR